MTYTVHSVRFDKTFISNHLEKYDTIARKMIAGKDVTFIVECY